MSHRITIVIADAAWRKLRGLSVRLRHAARLALLLTGEAISDVELTILLGDDERLKDLNSTFRGKDKPTNVLSFPAHKDGSAYLGDIAIAYGVTATEAQAAGKSFGDHAVHLAVHGVLHLMGYDHETTRDARIMEPLESSILAELGIADPYAARTNAA